MTINIPVRLDSILDWEAALTVLSIERCHPFFSEMGLPPAVSAEPMGLARCVRSCLENKSSTVPSNRDIYVAEKRQWLEKTFDRIAADCGEETARSIHTWCLRYFVDDSTASGLYAWGSLFHQLCRPGKNDEITVASPFDSATMTRICRVVDLDREREFMREIRQRIEAARALPQSEWEQWLEEGVRYRAGDGEIIGAVEAALTCVTLTISNHRTFQTWESLNGQISASEREHLVAWARQQAEDLGIPDCLVQAPPF